jgi:hypothetical protein
MIIPSYFQDKINDLNYKLPDSYYKAIELGLTNLDGWQFILNEKVFRSLFDKIYEDVSCLFLPFARRNDCDDVACFVISCSILPINSIIIIHLDYSTKIYNPSPTITYGPSLTQIPYGGKPDFDTFWDWFLDAIEEIIERYP